MISNATITLVIPSHNRADLISETIRSALNQTHPFAQIIVVDDASTDATLEVLRHFGSRITVIRSEKVGVQIARNKGVKAASTPYITLCDSDDLLNPDFVETKERWLRQAPECDSIYSNFVTFNKDTTDPDKFSGAPSGFFEGAIRDGNFISRIPDLYKKTVAFQPLFSSGVTIKKSFYEKIGGYNPAFNGIGSEDWEYTLRAVDEGDTSLCSRPLVKIRRHGGNDSANAVRQLLGEVTVLEHAANCHKSGKIYSVALFNGINSRRIQAFELAFGTKRYDIAMALLPMIRTKPRAIKFYIKAIIIYSLRLKRIVKLFQSSKEIHKPAA